MKKQVSKEEIASLCLELSLLLHAGVETGSALYLLAEEGEQVELLSDLARRVDEGAPSMRPCGKAGPSPFMSMAWWRWGSAPVARKRLCRPWPGTMRAGCGWPAGSAAPCCTRR